MSIEKIKSTDTGENQQEKGRIAVRRSFSGEIFRLSILQPGWTKNGYVPSRKSCHIFWISGNREVGFGLGPALLGNITTWVLLHFLFGALLRSAEFAWEYPDVCFSVALDCSFLVSPRKIPAYDTEVPLLLNPYSVPSSDLGLAIW